MAPISKKVGPGPAGKAGGNLISKTPAGKSNSVMKLGSKQNNSSSLAAKTSASSFGDKKTSSTNFGGSNASTSTISSGKNNSSNFSSTSNFGNKLGGASNDGKPSTASSFGGLGGNAKSSKISSDPFKTVTDKSYASSYMGPKNRKSSVKFGIIWLPTRKRNKMKDTVYNPYDTDKRDLFKERTPSMYNFNSGDTSDRQTFKKKEEETDLLVSERTKLPALSDGLSSNISNTGNSEEKQEFLKQNSEDSKEARGDSYEKDETNDYLENKSSLNKAPDATWEKDKSGDNVDSVYLRPPPPHKARSTASTVEDDDCGIKCLYYTLQCCDCVLM